eukprot:TRINITY_DN27983_c0_g2_i1.p2 TRINITY_DN27983_c0_g2~~TRINITY_DN27983_c0_g2_i1.p2  ORF type:complete len:200 (-),score=-15.08 TRINITY_DN27983_c0_g2_i1:377-976(-)
MKKICNRNIASNTQLKIIVLKMQKTKNHTTKHKRNHNNNRLHVPTQQYKFMINKSKLIYQTNGLVKKKQFNPNNFTILRNKMYQTASLINMQFQKSLPNLRLGFALTLSKQCLQRFKDQIRSEIQKSNRTFQNSFCKIQILRKKNHTLLIFTTCIKYIIIKINQNLQYPQIRKLNTKKLNISNLNFLIISIFNLIQLIS